MRAVVVDDEELGISRIVRLLKESGYLSYIKGYTRSKEAIENIDIDDADVAFLDIEMPEINGLMLAEILMERNPRIEVIFVTAHDKYALQAFEVHAIGYLLKPVQLDSIKQKLERILLRQDNDNIKIEEGSKKLYIKTFKHFLVSENEDMKNTIEFRTEKSKELLGLLLSYQGEPISKDKIIYMLWPDMEVERAVKNFHTTCYYVRKVIRKLGINNFILRKENGYSINMDCIDSDLNNFCSAIKEIKKKNPKIEIIKNAFFQYTGGYFENEDYVWVYVEKDYYEECFENICMFLSDYYESMGYTDKIQEILQYLLRINPLSEKACSRLIKINMKNGDIADAKRVYRNYAKNFKTEIANDILEPLEKLIE